MMELFPWRGCLRFLAGSGVGHGYDAHSVDPKATTNHRSHMPKPPKESSVAHGQEKPNISVIARDLNVSRYTLTERHSRQTGGHPPQQADIDLEADATRVGSI